MFGMDFDLGPLTPALNMLKAKLHMSEQDVPRAEVIERLHELAGHIAADPQAGVTVMRAKIGGKDVMILAASFEGKTIEAGAPIRQVPAELPA